MRKDKIEIKDLRIGNYLNVLGKTIEVECISNLPKRPDMYWIKPIDMIEIKMIHFSPIPLTKEWILNFGLHQHHADFGDDVIMLKAIEGSEHQWRLLTYPAELGSASTGKFRIIQFVHELQNVYQALTDVELTIKELV